MTTVAYNHKDKQVCIDSLLVVNSTIVCDHYDKSIEEDGCIFFLCGSVADYRKLVDCYKGANYQGIDAAAIMVKDGVAYHCCAGSDGFINIIELNYSTAIGRGDEVAITAMDYGASALEAVEHASKRTTSTGGKLRVYDLLSGEFAD